MNKDMDKAKDIPNRNRIQRQIVAPQRTRLLLPIPDTIRTRTTLERMAADNGG